MRFDNKMTKFYILTLTLAVAVVIYYNLWLGLGFLVVDGLICYSTFAVKKKNEEEWTQYIENLSMTMEHSTRKAVTNLPIPLCMCNADGNLSWYNKKFSELIGKKGLVGEKIEDLLESFTMEDMRSKIDNKSMHINIGEKRYNIVFLLDTTKKDEAFILYFIDVTELENVKKECKLSRPAILTIQVDSFDEVRGSTNEEDIPLLEIQIEKIIKVWAESKHATFRKCASDKYMVVMTEEQLITVERDKFQILDDVRAIDLGNTIPVTISIGASSYNAQGLRETQIAASSALDLALGRGGDQAVLKRNERYVFFGGKSKAIEKRTKVKARIISHAMKDLITESSNVIVMGHTYPDLDAFGAAMGVVGISRMLNKEVNIAMATVNTSIESIYNKVRRTELYKDLFVDSDEVMRKVKPGTLLVVVDTHRPSFTDIPKLIDMVDRIILIDHHRRGVEFLDKAVLVYHETYVSSSSEMVTELIQYTKDKPYVDSITAEALLAGIMLDTKNFSFKTGVRTFEAAAFLRKLGADTVEVRTFFQGDASLYLLKAEAIQNVKVLGGKVAISYLDSAGDDFKLAASQSADELLNLKGIKASFVLAQDAEGNIQVSARSLGDINVQLIMEKLGGGGHLNTAAAQFNDMSTVEAIEKIEEMIMEYIQEEGI